MGGPGSLSHILGDVTTEHLQGNHWIGKGDDGKIFTVEKSWYGRFFRWLGIGEWKKCRGENLIAASHHVREALNHADSSIDLSKARDFLAVVKGKSLSKKDHRIQHFIAVSQLQHALHIGGMLQKETLSSADDIILTTVAEDGLTPFHAAALHGDLPMMSKLLSPYSRHYEQTRNAFQNIEALKLDSRDGKTPMHMVLDAIKESNVGGDDACKMLYMMILANKEMAYVANNAGQTPFQYAEALGGVPSEVMVLLQNLGDDPSGFDGCQSQVRVLGDVLPGGELHKSVQDREVLAEAFEDKTDGEMREMAGAVRAYRHGGGEPMTEVDARGIVDRFFRAEEGELIELMQQLIPISAEHPELLLREYVMVNDDGSQSKKPFVEIMELKLRHDPLVFGLVKNIVDGIPKQQLISKVFEFQKEQLAGYIEAIIAQREVVELG